MEFIQKIWLWVQDKKNIFKKKDKAGKVVLVHGYCAVGNPFTTSSFTDYLVFSDPNKNRHNDEFALLIKSFIEPYGKVSFVAHSQGGHATLHLYTFYWSGNDLLSNLTRKDDNARRIQTVGTPWQGSGLAGSLASLGSAIGYGCGNCQDITHDGANNWLTTIPVSARKEVYVYTTQYKDLSWCSLATNMVLDWPNDGVTEVKWAVLSGANDRGLKKGWCHTTELSYPAQGTDTERNQEMNSKAARQ